MGFRSMLSVLLGLRVFVFYGSLGMPALHYAALSGHVETCRAMLEARPGLEHARDLRGRSHLDI